MQNYLRSKDIKSVFEGPAHTKWRSLREAEDSRYLGLTAPRFLLRLPYSPTENPVKLFNYTENVKQDHDHYLWGNTAFLLASCINDSLLSTVGAQILLAHKVVVQLAIFLYTCLKQWANYKLKFQLRF